MMKISRIIIFWMLISIAVPAASTFLRAEVIDKIAIVVNGEIITQRDIDNLLVPIFQKYETIYKGDELMMKLEEARQKIIEQLIDERLILSEAKKLNIEVSELEVDGKVDEIIKRVGSRENFESALARQQVSIKDLRQHYKDQTMIRKLIDRKVGSRIVITPIDVSDFYNAHANEFVSPKEIKLRNIMVRPKEGLDTAKAIELINSIETRLKEGGDFGELAKIYSDGPNAEEGGLIGFVRKGDMMPEIEKVVLDLQEGEISGIVQTGLGYHIFKVEEIKEERKLELSEVRREIEEAIFIEQSREKTRGWLESLKKNAYIAFK